MEYNYSQYAEQLSAHFNLGMGVLILISCVFIALAIFIFWMKQPRLAIFTVLFGVILVFIGYYFALFSIRRDIDTSNYIVYEGRFYVEDYYTATRSGTFILIQTTNDSDAIRYQVACNNINTGTKGEYYGYFVYSADSKYVVDFYVEEVSDSSTP